MNCYQGTSDAENGYKITLRDQGREHDLMVLFFFYFRLRPLFELVNKSKFTDGRVHLRESGVKGLI